MKTKQPPNNFPPYENDGHCQNGNSRKRVTASDVARCAGVSRTTVSIVLSDRRDIVIPESTRDRIKKCAEELGYVPSLLGQGFLKGKSKIVGVYVRAYSYQSVMDWISGAFSGLAMEDYVPIILSSSWLNGYAKRPGTPSRPNLADTSEIRRLVGHQVDGVLYFSTDPAHTAASLSELARLHVPVVVVGIECPEIETDYVGCDNQEVGTIAARHLLSLGYSSFAFADYTVPLPPFQAISESFASEVGAAGLPCKAFPLAEGNPLEVRRRLPKLVKPPVGILCSSDNLAANVIQAAHALGWRVPEDIAVVGIGGTELARYNLLPITSVNRNSYHIGHNAAHLLVSRINGLEGPPKRTVVRPTLEIRESTIPAERPQRGQPAKKGRATSATRKKSQE